MDQQDSTGASRKPVSIPDHTLLRRIGRGSYGEVWLARNMMGMYRAVKIVYRSSFQHQRPYERELSGITKFEPISRSYEGFVDVLHVGINEPEGYFYYVMELGDDEVTGQKIDPDNYIPKTLAKHIAAHQRLPLQECLQLGLALSQALAELHKHNLVHRDVKPSNIIFVNGVPKLADIGLVADLGEARSYVGTEGFIPPEGPGTPAADVYSLGKILYEAGTGKDRQEFPELPTLLDTFSDQTDLLELNEVIIHACENDPRKRYHAAWDMYADLLVLADGKSVKRLRLLERRWANFKRITGVGVAIMLGLAVIAFGVYREWKNVQKSRHDLIKANIIQGNRALETGDPQRALLTFADAARLDDGNSESSLTHRLRFNSTLTQVPKLATFLTTGEEVHDIEFSPAGDKILIGYTAGKAAFFDLKANRWATSLVGGAGRLSSVAFNTDASRLLTTSQHENAAYIWDGESAKILHVLRHPNFVMSAKFASNGTVLTACSDGAARLWREPWEKPFKQFKNNGDGLRYANVSVDGRLIVTASKDFTAIVWNAETGEKIGPPLEHASWVKFAAFSADGRLLVTSSSDHTARVWLKSAERPGYRLLHKLTHGDEVQSAEFSPDGRLLMTASLDNNVRVWRVEDLSSSDSILMLHQGARVMRASFSGDGHRLAIACSDGSIRIWDLAGCGVTPSVIRATASADACRWAAVTPQGVQVVDALSGQTISQIPVSERTLVRTKLNPNGRFAGTVLESIAGMQTNRSIQVWDIGTTNVAGPEIIITNVPFDLAISADGTRLLVYSTNIVRVWDVSTGKELPSVIHDEKISTAFLAADATRMVIQSGNKVRVCDVATARDAFPPLVHKMKVKHAACSPNGLYLVTCCADDDLTASYAQVWFASTGAAVGPQLEHTDGVLHASFSPDSTRVATAGEDFKATVWDFKTGKRIVPRLEHMHQVQTVRFNSNGKWVLTASSDQSARVWDGKTGDPLTVPLRHLTKLTDATFLQDGAHLMTSAGPNALWIWPLPINARPADDMVLLARLLSASPISDDAASPSKSWENAWRALREKYPSDFTVSPEEVAAWHEFQAEDSEKQNQWFAAVFHWKQLLAARPNDSIFQQRLEKAQARLNSEK